MKKISPFFAFLLIAASSLSLSGCGEDSSASEVPSSEEASSSSEERYVLSASEIYAKVNKSTVFILIEKLDGYASGTGFFIDDEGTFVTNYHVIEDGKAGAIADYQGNAYTIDYVKGYDEGLDIAICASSAVNTHAASLGNSDKVSVGDTVYAIGYPAAFKLGASSSTFTSGMVSMNRSVGGYSYIQATVDITNGNSGGPLINDYGEVIGITTAGIKYNDIDYMNLSVPISRISIVSRDGKDSIYTVTKRHYNMPVKLYVDGQLKTTLQIPYGQTASFPTYSKTGHTFDGWYTDSSYTKRFSSNSAITDPMSLYGQHLPNQYKIHLNANGGALNKSFVNVTYGSYYELPEPSKDGYSFIGWIRSSDNKVFSSGTYFLDDDLYLDASYEAINYSITYSLNGGECDGLKTTYTVEDSFVLPTPTKSGYRFLGWSKTNDSSDASTNVWVDEGTMGSLRFYAFWEAKTYSLTLDVNGGDALDKTDYQIVYDSYFALPTPTRVGYSFDGWYLSWSSTKVTSGTWQWDRNVTLVAKWKPISYSISYNLNGGVLDENNPTSYTIESGFTLVNPTRSGYEFLGWSGTGLDDYATSVSVAIGSTGNRSYVANWNALTYTVTLDASGASCAVDSFEVEYASSYTLPVLSKEGYDFLGWYYDEERVNSSGNWAIASDVTLVAKFELTKWNLTYNLDGGTTTNPSTFTILDEITLTAPTKKGYDFLGWVCSDLEANSPTKNLVIPSGTCQDLTIEARWSLCVYEVTLDPNGGTCEETSLDVSYGESFSLPTPYLRGYEFLGWYCGETKVDESSPWAYDYDLTLKAKWQEYSCKFTYAYDTDGYQITAIDFIRGTRVYIPTTYNGQPVTSIGKLIFTKSTNVGKAVTHIDILDNIKRISTFNYFYGCPNLAYYLDEGGNKFLGNEGNHYLVLVGLCTTEETYVTKPETKIFFSVGKTLEPYSYMNVKSLTLSKGLTVPDSLMIRGSNLEKVYLLFDDSETKIQFYDNDSLTYVYFGKGITGFKAPLFPMCDNLTSVDYEGTIEEWKAITKRGGWNAATGGWNGGTGAFYGTTRTMTIHCSDGDYVEEGQECSNVL